MTQPPFVAIGHIANDVYPSAHLGGGVSYSAITAARMGYKASIYTKCSTDSPYISELSSMGITVHVLPSKKDTTTTFDNRYDVSGHRTQKAYDLQESISPGDLNSLRDIPTGATILVAPIVGEIDTALYSYFSEKGRLCITPQGYFRDVGQDGSVTQKKWQGFQNVLSGAITVLSEEDITIAGAKDESLLRDIVSASAIVALTEGDRGVTVFEKGNVLHTDAFHLSAEEAVDFTGAGDVFAAVFMTEIVRNGGDAKAASIEACFVAATKIKSITGGIGIASIPTMYDIQKFR